MFPIGGSAGWAGQVCAKVDFVRSPGEIEMRFPGLWCPSPSSALELVPIAAPAHDGPPVVVGSG